ncbi:hypothetical protein ACH5AG_07890 [Streptomyces anulatus]
MTNSKESSGDSTEDGGRLPAARRRIASAAKTAMTLFQGNREVIIGALVVTAAVAVAFAGTPKAGGEKEVDAPLVPPLLPGEYKFPCSECAGDGSVQIGTDEDGPEDGPSWVTCEDCWGQGVVYLDEEEATERLECEAWLRGYRSAA